MSKENLVWLCLAYTTKEGEPKIRSVKTTSLFYCDIIDICGNADCQVKIQGNIKRN